MQHLEVSCAVRPLKWSLGVKWLIRSFSPLFTTGTSLFVSPLAAIGNTKHHAYLKYQNVITREMLHLTISVDQSPSWEANSSKRGQEIPRILWAPKVYFRIHSSRHLSQTWARWIHSVSPHPRSWSVSILFFHLHLGFASGLLPSTFSFPHHSPVCTSPLPSKCHMHHPFRFAWFRKRNIW